jgi:hypothetical protein
MPVKPSEQEEEYFARLEFERRKQALAERQPPAGAPALPGAHGGQREGSPGAVRAIWRCHCAGADGPGDAGNGRGRVVPGPMAAEPLCQNPPHDRLSGRGKGTSSVGREGAGPGTKPFALLELAQAVRQAL